MLSENCIEQIKDKAGLVEVISEYTELKQKGVNWMGCCPIHNEKTPSLSVSPVKGIWKCFGCGRGGNVISFVMEKEKVSFLEAIEILAAKMNIELEFEQHVDKATYKERKDKEKEKEMVMRWAEDWYHRKLMETPRESTIWQTLFDRGYTEEWAVAWRLGFAPDSSDNIKGTLINQGKYEPALQCGLIKTSSGVSRDFFRNRLMIPIHTHLGTIAGFGARSLDTDGKYAKYLNPLQNDNYDKGALLFGLWQAKEYIRKYGFAYLVEGYFDVTTFHEMTARNTVGTCGTALTQAQVRLLKRHTNHVIMVGDGDAAGIKAMERNLELLLAEDLRVELVQLPEGEDPDSWARKMFTTAKAA